MENKTNDLILERIKEVESFAKTDVNKQVLIELKAILNEATNKKEQDRIEKIKRHWKFHDCGAGYELENWADNGVDIIIDCPTKEDWLKSFDEYFENFDIDEEIDFYRQNEDYRNNFTISESLEDFTNFVNEWKEGA